VAATADFSLRTHWDAVYASPRTAEREWLASVAETLPAVCAQIDGARGRRALVPGCGLSRLGEALAERGWQVTNVDFSEPCVALGRAACADPTIAWAVADVRAMRCFADGAFDAIVDKGTLDALMCGDGFDADVPRYAAELRRVLAPGGRFVAVSLSQPSIALPLLTLTPTAAPSTAEGAAADDDGWAVRVLKFEGGGGRYRLFVGQSLTSASAGDEARGGAGPRRIGGASERAHSAGRPAPPAAGDS
jgi:ubiquinone/menaquinone biosynthesis C-methylase UbiE